MEIADFSDVCSETVLNAILSLFSSEVCLVGSGGALVSLWPAVDAVYRQRSWVASDSPGDAQWTCLGLAAAELIGDYLAVSGFVGSRLGRSEILNCWIVKCVLATMRSLRGSCWFCPCLRRRLWQNWTALAAIAWPGSEDCELHLGWDGEMTIVVGSTALQAESVSWHLCRASCELPDSSTENDGAEGAPGHSCKDQRERAKGR